MNKFELVCFDMAGTTMIDSGLVLESFRRTIDELGVSGREAVGRARPMSRLNFISSIRPETLVFEGFLVREPSSRNCDPRASKLP